MLAQPLSAILTLRPALTPIARVIVEAVCLAEGSIGSANSVAQTLGLRNRFTLARLLKREGVPPLHRLAGWATVLSWVIAAEEASLSLCRLAFRAHRHPSACYRLVREVTGLCWDKVRTRGSTWVQQRLLAELRKSRTPLLSAHAPGKLSYS